MINMKIEEETLLNLLMNRIDFWEVDNETRALFYEMYERNVFNGVFENMEFDIKEIVDNDYINYCSVIDKTDDYFKIIKKKFKKEGYCDISGETPYSYIEATNEDNSKFLIRN